MKIAVLVSGGGTNLQAIIDQVQNKSIANTSIEVVISNKKDAYALTRAKDNGIDARYIAPKEYESREAFNTALVDCIDSYGVDLIVLAGYLVIIPEALVKKYENKIINIHPSLIPSFCGPGMYGLKVHESVLNRGVKVTGATVHIVDTGVDSGPIILQKAVQVQQGDTPEILQQRVMKEAEWSILPKAIDLFAKEKIVVQEGRVIIK